MLLLLRTNVVRLHLFVLAFLCIAFFSPVLVRAESSEPVVSVGAGSVNTDLRTSSITFEAGENGNYILAFKIENSGHLSADDARVSLILSDGWKYDGTKGEYRLVQTQERLYGQAVEWQLVPIAGGGSTEFQSTIIPPEGSEPTPLFAALTSKYSVPVYAEIAVGEPDPASFWSSRIRSFWLYLSYTAHEFFFRLSAWLSLN
ncbi:hypothetical protein K8R04_01485 [Candidatus Uhrbacteria bacterium]|nr:hypothetical protein [Candidatus Uhrbacteria bacterium]